MRNPTWKDRLRSRWRRRSKQRKKRRDDGDIRFQLSRLEERRVLAVTAGLIAVDVLQISMDAAGDTATVSMNLGNLEVNGSSFGSGVNSIVVEASAHDDQTLEVVSDLTLANGISAPAAEDIDRIILSKSITSTTGDIILEADELVSLGPDGDLLSDSGDITLRSNNVLSTSATSRVDADVDGAGSAGGDILISAARLALGEINTDADVSLTATANEVTDQSSIEVGGSLTVAAQAFIHLNSLDVDGGVRLAAATGSITVFNSGDLDLRDANAATHMTATSTGGSISDASGGALDSIEVGDGLQITANQDVDLDSLDVMGNIGVSAGGDASLVNVGDVNLNVSNVVGDLDVTSTTGRVFDASSGATATPLLFDFDGSVSSTTASGYTSVLPNQLYNAIDGFGWESAVSGFDRSFTAGPRLDLRNDAHFGSTPAVFRVDLANGDYFLNINFGDSFASEDIRLTMLGAPNQVLFDNVGQGPSKWFHDGIRVTVVNGSLRFQISDQGGATTNWLLNSLEITPVAANQAAAASIPGPVAADGVTIDTIAGTGAANEIYTVTIGSGVIVSADASSLYAGHQVQAAGDGTFSVDIRRPTVTGLADLAFESLGGQGFVHLDQADEYSFFMAPLRRFDLNHTVVEPGWAGVASNQIFSATNDVGWNVGLIGFSWIGTLGAPEEVLRDGHASSANATFQVAVEMGKSYETKLYFADITQGYPSIGIGFEGTPAFSFTYVQGTVEIKTHTFVAGDNVLDIEMSTLGSAWILNGVTVEELNPAAPPAVEPSFRGKAGAVVVGGNADFNAPLGHVDLDDFDVSGLVGVDALNTSTLKTTELSLGTVVVDGAGENFFGTASLNDISLGTLTVDGLVSITAENGSIVDDADSGATDILAQSALLDASGSVGSAANPIETMLTKLEVDAATSLVLSNQGDLAVGGVSGFDGVQVGDKATISGTGKLTLDEAIVAANRITINVTGDLADDADADVDLVAPEAVVTAADAGTAGDAVETSLARVEGSFTGDAHLDNDQALTIGGIGQLAGLTANGDIRLTNSGNVLLDSPLSAGALAHLDISAGLLDDNDADADLVAAQLTLEVVGAAGAVGAAIDTQVAALEGNVGGGLFLDSSSALELGGASALYSGVSAALVDIDSAGILTASESVSATSGPIDLRGDLAIAINAALVTSGQTISIDAAGDVTFSASGSVDTQTAASVNIDADGQLSMADSSSANARGGAIVVLAQNDATLASLMTLGGSVQVTSVGGSILDGGDAAKEVESATADLRAAGDIGAAGNLLETKLAKLEAEADSVFLDNMGSLTIGDLSGLSGITATVADIRLVNMGDVLLHEAITAVDLIVLLVTGSILDQPNANVDIASTSLVIDVSGNVGAGNTIETQVANLEGDVGGDVQIQQTGPLQIGGASASEDGLGANSLTIKTNADVVAGEAVQTQGGPLVLDAGGSLDVNTSVQSNGNTIELRALGDLRFDANGLVDTQSAATVTMTTNAALAMSDGVVVNARGGMLGVDAVGNASLSSLKSLGGAVTVTSSAGSILDAGDAHKDVDAATTVLVANTAIGDTGDALDTRLAKLEATAGTDVFLANMGPLTIGAISAVNGLNANGEIELSNNNDITLDELVFASRVRIDINSGSLFDDGDVDDDLAAADLVLDIDGAAGTVGDKLELKSTRLEGALTGDANLHNVSALAIGGADAAFAGLTVGGSLCLDVDSNLTLDETLDVAVDATIGLAGNLSDDADAQLDLRAQRLALTATGNTGTAGDLIESELDVVEIAAQSEIAFANSGALQVGSFGALVGVNSNSGNVLLINDADLTLDESVSGNRVDIDVTGSIIDNDNAADVIANRAVLVASANVGVAGDRLELQVDQLELASGGNAYLENDRAIIVGGNHLTNGVQTTGEVVFDNDGDVTLDERLAAGTNMLVVVNGNILDDADAETDIKASSLRVDVTGSVGSSGDRIESSLDALEGVVTVDATLNNDRVLTIGGLHAVDGLSVGGDLSLLNQASLILDERLSAGGLASLNTVGAVTDDGDAAIDLAAAQATVQATGIGLAGDRLETSISALEASSSSGVFLSNNGPLTIGGVGALNGVTAAANVGIDNVGDVLLDESIALAGDLTVDVTGGGSLLDDNDIDVDLSATTAVLNVHGSIGTGGDDLESQLAKLEGAGGANIFISNSGLLSIGGIGAVNGLSAGGNIKIANDADVQLDETLAATGDLVANVTGSLLDDADADLDLAANRAELTISGSVGLAADPLETMILNLEAVIGGEVILVNTGPLTIGGVTGLMSGVSASSADISSTGILQVNESLTTSGSQKLQSNSNINLVASLDTQVAGSVEIDAGGVLTMTDGVTVNSHGGDIDAKAQGDVTLGGLISSGGDVTVDSTAGKILDGGDSHKEIDADSAVLTAQGDIGGAANALETRLAMLESNGASLHLDNMGPLTIGDINGIPGVVANVDDIRLSSMGDLNLHEALTAVGQISLTVIGSVHDEPNAAVDVEAARLLLDVSGDFGVTGEAVETKTAFVEGDVFGEFIVDNDGPLTVGGVSAFTGLQTGNATIHSSGAVSVNETLRVQTGPLVLNGDGTLDINASILTSGTSADLHAVGAVTFSAAGLLDAQSTANLSVSTDASMLMHDLAVVDARGGAVDVMSDGDATISHLRTIGGDVSLTSVNGAILDGGESKKDIDASTAQLKSAADIGAAGAELETQLSSLEADAGNNIRISNMGVLEIGGVSPLVGLTAGGLIELQNNANVLLLERVDAGVQFHAVVAGSLLDDGNTSVDIITPALLLDVSGDAGILADPLELQVANLEGTLGGSLIGDNSGSLTIGGVTGLTAGLTAATVKLNSTDSIQVDENVNASGDVKLHAGTDASGGDSIIMNGSAVIDAGDVELDATADVVVSSVVSANDIAIMAGGAIADHANDALTDLDAAGETVLRAVGGIDGPAADGKLDLAANSKLDAIVSGPGAMRVRFHGGGTIRQATTFDGVVDIMASDSLDAQSVSAGDDDSSGNGHIQIVNATNDILVGLLTATDEVFLNAVGGSILDSTNDAVVDIQSGDAIRLMAQGKIADAFGGALEVAADSTVDAQSLLGGDVRLTSPGALTLLQLSTASGDAQVNAVDDLTIHATDVNGNLQAVSTAGDILNPTGQIDVSGAASFTTSASAGQISLGQTDAARIAGPVTLVANSDAALTNDLDINFATSDIGGNLLAESQGNILNGSGSLTVAGMATLDVGQAIKLGLANTLDVAQAIGATSVGDTILNTANAIDFKTSQIGGNLIATSSGAITNLSGSLDVTLMSTLTASEVQLGVANNFNNGGSLGLDTVGDAVIQTASNLDLKASDVGGSLSITMQGGDLSDSAAVAVASDATIRSTVALNNVSLDTLDLSGQLDIDTLGDALIRNAGALNVVAGASLGQLTLEALGGDLQFVAGLTANGVLRLIAAGAINGAGLLQSAQVELDAGAGIGDLNSLEMKAQSIRADSTGSGDIDLINDSNLGVNVTSISTVGGDILFEQKGAAVTTFSGAVTSGGAVDGGHIEIIGESGVAVLASATLSSLGGVGGQLAISGAVVDTIPLLGKGDIIIRGGGGDVIITVDIISDTDIDIAADRDIIVLATIRTTDGANISLTADADLDGFGGLWVNAAGEIDSDGQLTALGSDVFATPFELDAIRVDDDVAGHQMRANSDLSLTGRALTPGAAIVIDGGVEMLAPGAILTVVGLDVEIDPNTGSFSSPNGVVSIAAVGNEKITLGANAANTLSLVTNELDAVTADVLVIGNPASGGDVDVAGRVDSSGVLILASSSEIAGAGVLAVSQLGLIGTGNVSLTGANEFGSLSGAMVGGDVHLVHVDVLQIGSIAGIGVLPGIDGLAVNGGVLTLDAAQAVTQSANSPIEAAGLLLLGGGDQLLTSTMNNIDVLASDVVGQLDYRDSGDVIFGQLHGVDGVTAQDDVRIHVDGSLTFQSEVVSIGNQIELIADGNTVIDQNVGNDVTSNNLVIVSASGIGSTGNPLETTVSTFEGQAGAGGLFIVNDGALVVGGLSQANGGIAGGATSGGGALSITANSPLSVAEDVTNSGDILLTASPGGGADDLTVSARVVSTGDGTIELTAGDDIVVNDVGAAPEVYAHGNGPIVFKAGRDVVIDNDVVMGSEFGSFVTFPQVEEGVTLFVVPVDQGGSNVDAFGNAIIRVNVGIPGEVNFRVTVDWSDGVVEEYPYVGVGNAPESSITRLPGGVDFLLRHKYNGNPSSNPADPIPVTVTIGLDAKRTSGGAVFNGIQFFTEGEFGQQLVTTVSRLQTVPGEGIQTYVPPVVHELDPIVARPSNSALILNQSSNSADAYSETFEMHAGELEEARIGDMRVFFRVVDDVANKEDPKDYDLPVDSLKDVLRKFEQIKLRNGHYRIYVEDPATGKVRLMHDVHIFNGKLVPADFRKGVGERLPGANDGAALESVENPVTEIVSKTGAGVETQRNVDDQQVDLDLVAPRAVEAENDASDQSPKTPTNASTETGDKTQDEPTKGIDIEPSATTSWRTQSRAAALAAGVATIAAVGNWKESLERSSQDESYELSRAARRRRRVKRKQTR